MKKYTNIELDTIIEEHLTWFRGNGGRKADLSYANLRGKRLRGVNFYGANFSRADFSGADLRNVNFSDAIMRGTDFSGADVSGADFSSTKLCKAKFLDSDLRGVNFSGADLRGVNFSGANLSGADFQNITSLIYCEVSWSAHGDWGRKLLAVQIGNEVRYFCECFTGSIDDLREYIARGGDKYKRSRTIAADFCEARMTEMIEKKVRSWATTLNKIRAQGKAVRS